MKKLLLSVVTLAASFAGFSQQLIQGFESGTFPPTGWFEYHSATDGLDESTAQANTGTTSAFFDDVNGTDTMILISSTIPSLTAGSQLTFWEWTQYSGSYYDYHGVWASINGAAPIELSEMPGAAADGAWTEKIIDLSAYAGSAITLSFVYVGDWADEWHIDDILVDLAPSCAAPINLTSISATSVSADIEWTSMGTETTWLLEYGITGYTPGAGTLDTATNDTTTLTGLTASTTYDVYVRAFCGVGDSSSWVGPISFTTACNAVVAPWTEDFETNTTSIPNCFNQGGANVKDWLFTNVGTGHIGNAGTIGGTTSSNGYFAWVDDSSPHDTTVMTSPLIDVSTLTVPALSFYLLSNNEGYTNVNFSIDVYDGASWNNDFFTNNTNTTAGEWEKFVLDLSTLTITGDIQFRLVVREFNGTDFYDDIAIDDITVDELPSCLDPNAIALDSISNDYALLNWIENGTATSWEVQYDTAGFTPGTGTIAVTGTKPYGLSSLNSSASYDFYVRSICAVGDTSGWAGPFAFMTPCADNTGDNPLVAYPVNALMYTDTVNTADSCLSDIAGRTTNDAWFKIATDSCAVDLSISTCNSAFDNLLYVFNDTLLEIADNDDNGPVCGGTTASAILVAGTDYTAGDTLYLAVEGYSSDGDIIVDIMQGLPSAELGADTNTCSGDSVTLANTGTTGGVYTSNGGTVDTNGVFTSAVGGMFEVYYTVGAGTCVSSDTVMVTVDTLNLAVTVSNDTATATSAGTYQWIDCANGDTAVAGATMQWFKPASSGTYAVIVTGACGSDTSACVTIATTGIENNTSAISGIYPNPTTGSFTLTLNKSNATVEVLNTVGQVVYSKNVTSTVTNIELSNVAKGSYMIRVTANGTQSIEKLIIK